MYWVYVGRTESAISTIDDEPMQPSPTAGICNDTLIGRCLRETAVLEVAHHDGDLGSFCGLGNARVKSFRKGSVDGALSWAGGGAGAALGMLELGDCCVEEDAIEAARVLMGDEIGASIV